MALSLRPYQEDWLDSIAAAYSRGITRQLGRAGTGLGKCIDPESYVWSGGLKKFGSIWGSGRIMAPSGMQPVNGWYDDGSHEGCKVTLSNGLEIDGTLDHRVWVRTREGYEGWRRLADLSKSFDYVAVARGRADFGTEDIPADEAYALGLVVADGCVVQGCTQLLRIDKQYPVLERIVSVVYDWVALSGGRISNTVRIKNISNHHDVLSANAPRFRQMFCQRYGYNACRSENKSVPNKILTGTRNSVVNFLRGYFDGDGYCCDGVGVSSASKVLSNQVSLLLTGLGVLCSVKEKQTTNLPAYIVTVHDTDAFRDAVGFTRYGLTKDVAFDELLAKPRNTNIDVVPGVSCLIKAARARVEGRSKGWLKNAAIYARGERLPSYSKLRAWVDYLPPSEERSEMQALIDNHYAWVPVERIEESTISRIDCEVDVEHAFIANGVVNHNTALFSNLPGKLNLTRKMLVLVHREELALQAAEKLKLWNPTMSVGVEMGERRSDPADQLIVAGVPTIGRAGSTRLARFDPQDFGVVVGDEGHHFLAKTYLNVLNHFGCMTRKDLLLLLVTATPNRADGRGLDQIVQEIVFDMPLSEGIKGGWLSEIRGFRTVTQTDISSVPTEHGEFQTGALSSAVDTPARNDQIVRAWLDVASDRRTVVFAVDVQHAKDLAEMFKKYGIVAEAVWGDDPYRREKLQLHRAGKIQVLANCQLLCLDEQTEILTSTGWEGIDTINPSHHVANWKDGNIYFEPPLDIFKRDRAKSERMVVLETPRRSIRVTEGHNMLYRTYKGQAFRKDKACELVDRNIDLPVSGYAAPLDIRPVQPEALTPARFKRIVSAAAFNLRKLESYGRHESFVEAERRVNVKYSKRYLNPRDLSLAECKFIGFWIGDGTRSKLKSGGIEYVICQSTVYPHIIKWFDNVLARTKFHVIKRHLAARPGVNSNVRWSLCRGTGGGSQERAGGLFCIEPYLNKDGTNLFKGLNTFQFNALLEGWWMADGTHGAGTEAPKNGFRLACTNIKLLTIMQEVAVCRGYRATITPLSPPTNSNHNQQWCLSLTRRKEHHTSTINEISALHFESGWKNERVWCVKTTSGNIVTRRRGTVTVMGNCEGYDDPAVDCIVIAKPTQSSSNYEQMVGRATRIPSDIYNLHDARKAGIKPSKVDCVVLDVVDVTKKHSLNSISSLFGFGPAMDLKGTPTLIVQAKLDEAEAKGVSLDRLEDFTKIDSYVEEVNLFKVEYPPEIVQVSEYQWHRTRSGSYVLLLAGADNVVVYPDLLDRWNIYGTVNGREFNSRANDFENAIREADQMVRTLGGRSVAALAKRSAKWHDAPVTPAQKVICKNMRIVIPSGATKGEVHLAINRRLSELKKTA